MTRTAARTSRACEGRVASEGHRRRLLRAGNQGGGSGGRGNATTGGSPTGVQGTGGAGSSGVGGSEPPIGTAISAGSCTPNKGVHRAELPRRHSARRGGLRHHRDVGPGRRRVLLRCAGPGAIPHLGLCLRRAAALVEVVSGNHSEPTGEESRSSRQRGRSSIAMPAIPRCAPNDRALGVTQRDDRVDPRRPQRRQQRRRHRHDPEQRRRGDVDRRIVRAHAVEQRRDQPA